MPDYTTLESHTTIIIGKAASVKNRANQVIELANRVNTKIHNDELTQSEVDELEGHFDEIKASYNDAEAELTTTDEPVGEVEGILGD